MGAAVRVAEWLLRKRVFYLDGNGITYKTTEAAQIIAAEFSELLLAAERLADELNHLERAGGLCVPSLGTFERLRLAAQKVREL